MRGSPEFHMFQNVILQRKPHTPKWSVLVRKCSSHMYGRCGAIRTDEGIGE